MNVKLYRFENNNFVLKAVIDDIQQISWEHNLYSAGQFTISINYNIPNAKLFERGIFVQFENDPYMFGEISTITNSIGQNGKGSEMLNISGYDARYLFKRRVIKNLNNNETWSMTAKGELCMRNLIADQCGSNAETKRRLPITNIIPEASSAIGEDYSVSESFSSLYDVLVTIATQSKIGWRIKFDGSLTLEVYSGSDLSNSVFLSTDYESLANGSFSDTSNSFANSIYIAGKGSGSERDLYEGENGTPSGFDRFEAYDNQSSMSTEEEYRTEAENMLIQYGQTITISGAGLVKCPYVFKQQYNIGDTVTVEFSGKRAAVQILSVTESWNWNKYGLSFNFGKPRNSLDEQLQLMLRKLSAASNTSSACESIKWYNIATETSQEQKDVTFNTLGFTGVIPTGGKTFTLYCDDEGVGAKSYKIYTKNLTGSDSLTLTTGVTGAENASINAGNNIIMVIVDTDGNVIMQSSTAELPDDSVTTPKISDDAVTTPKIDDGAVTLPKVSDEVVSYDVGYICTTASNIQDKEITVGDNFVLKAGVVLKVLFRLSNTTDNPNLKLIDSDENVIATIPIAVADTTGNPPRKLLVGKTIKTSEQISGQWIGSSNFMVWDRYTILDLMYDGTYFVIMGNPVLLWGKNVHSYTTSVSTNEPPTGNYIVRANGEIEQWGAISGSGFQTVYFFVEYGSSDNYFATAIGNTSDTSRNYGADNYTTASVRFYLRNGSNRYYSKGIYKVSDSKSRETETDDEGDSDEKEEK